MDYMQTLQNIKKDVKLVEKLMNNLNQNLWCETFEDTLSRIMNDIQYLLTITDFFWY